MYVVHVSRSSIPPDATSKLLPFIHLSWRLSSCTSYQVPGSSPLLRPLSFLNSSPGESGCGPREKFPSARTRDPLDCPQPAAFSAAPPGQGCPHNTGSRESRSRGRDGTGQSRGQRRCSNRRDKARAAAAAADMLHTHILQHRGEHTGRAHLI